MWLYVRSHVAVYTVYTLYSALNQRASEFKVHLDCNRSLQRRRQDNLHQVNEYQTVFWPVFLTISSLPLLLLCRAHFSGRISNQCDTSIIKQAAQYNTIQYRNISCMLLTTIMRVHCMLRYTAFQV